MKVLQLLCYIIMFCWRQTVGITDKVGTKKLIFIEVLLDSNNCRIKVVMVLWNFFNVFKKKSFVYLRMRTAIWAFCHSNKNTRFKKYTHWEYLFVSLPLSVSACLCAVWVQILHVRNRNMSVWKYEECLSNHQVPYLQSALNLLSHNGTFCQDKIWQNLKQPKIRR